MFQKIKAMLSGGKEAGHMHKMGGGCCGGQGKHAHGGHGHDHGHSHEMKGEEACATEEMEEKKMAGGCCGGKGHHHH